MNSHTIVIPTYNERENISLLVTDIMGLGTDSQVIIVDDNSPDGTGELADELVAQHPGVRVIHRPGKLGLGTAHIAGQRTRDRNGKPDHLGCPGDLYAFCHVQRYH